MTDVAPEPDEVATPAPGDVLEVEVVPVSHATSSNVPAPDEPPAEPVAPPSLEEAAAQLLVLVDEGHKLGDADVEAARADLRDALGDKVLLTRDERAKIFADEARAEAQTATDVTLTADAPAS